MSDKLPVESKKSEELDLVILFNLIGKSINKLYNLIISLFKGVLWLLIVILKPVFNNLKLIALVLSVAAIVGFFLEKVKKPVYFSEMIVKPYFESKYKLSNNINYFNSLIDTENINELVRIFEIDSADAASLISFEITRGPESPNNLLREYDEYLKGLDSVVANQINYDDYLNNRDLLSSSVFSITAKAHNKDVFLNLENGFRKTFENPYSKKLMKIRDETISIKKDAFMLQLKRLDSLQGIYFDLLKEESKNDNLSIKPDGGFPIQLQRTQTREFDLFQEEIKVRRTLRDLDQELIEESVFYDVVAGFDQEGAKYRDLLSNYMVLFPLAALVFLVSAYLLVQFYRFVLSYEI